MAPTKLTDEEFLDMRQKLHEELLAMMMHFELFQQLWADTDEKAEVMNRYVAFYQFTLQAHSQLVFVQICKVMDDGATVVSIRRFLNAAVRQPELRQHGDREALIAAGRKLRSHGALLKRIQLYRDRRLAHREMDYRADLIAPGIRLGETTALINDINDAYQLVSRAYDGRGFSLHPTPSPNATQMIEDLMELWRKRKAERDAPII